jgi:hypothetical protein
MEELFLKVTGDSMLPVEEETEESSAIALKAQNVTVSSSDVDYELTEGRPISAFQQWWILLLKRLFIFKRLWVPYSVAFVFAIAGAAIAPLLIKSFSTPLACPVPADLISEYKYRDDFGQSYYPGTTYYGDEIDRRVYVYGPAGSLDESRLALMADVYSINNTESKPLLASVSLLFFLTCV